jgi:hypothetical protein
VNSKKVIIKSWAMPQIDTEFDVANRMWIREIGRLHTYYGDQEIQHFSWVAGICVTKALEGIEDDQFVHVDPDAASVSEVEVKLPEIAVGFAIRAGSWTQSLKRKIASGEVESAQLALKTGLAKALRFVADYENHHFSPLGRCPSPAQLGYMRSVARATNILPPISARIDRIGATDFLSKHASTSWEYGGRPGDAGRA